MRSLTILLISGFLFSCNSEEKKPTETAGTPAQKKEDTHACYEGIHGRDTLLLELHRDGETISGQLQYYIFEKDGNTGTLHGLEKGDTLLAYYTFRAEGRESIRQVAFLHKDSSLYEGYGEMAEENGRMVFKKDKPLNFPLERPLKKVNCSR